MGSCLSSLTLVVALLQAAPWRSPSLWATLESCMRSGWSWGMAASAALSSTQVNSDSIEQLQITNHSYHLCTLSIWFCSKCFNQVDVCFSSNTAQEATLLILMTVFQDSLMLFSSNQELLWTVWFQMSLTPMFVTYSSYFPGTTVSKPSRTWWRRKGSLTTSC